MNTSEAYILNTLRSPDGIRHVYESICDEHETKEAIAEDTGIAESNVDTLLRGLVLLGMIERSGHAYSAVELTEASDDRTLDFRITILNNLAEAANGDDWGKQSVVLLNYQYLVSGNIQRFENNQTALFNDIDNWIESNTNYRPKEGGNIYSHNRQKFQNWSRLVNYLGLAQKVSGREHTVYPEPGLLLAAVRLAAAESEYLSGDAADLSIREFLTWLDTNLIRIGYTLGDPVPAVLSRTLLNLVRADKLRLVEAGDDPAATLQNTPRRDGIEREANAIKLQ